MCETLARTTAPSAVMVYPNVGHGFALDPQGRGHASPETEGAFKQVRFFPGASLCETIAPTIVGLLISSDLVVVTGPLLQRRCTNGNRDAYLAPSLGDVGEPLQTDPQGLHSVVTASYLEF
jgi:hypothetical protein